MSLAQEKLEAIVLYLAEHVPDAHIEILPLQEASAVYVLNVRMPSRHLRLEIGRPLIEDMNHSVEKVRQYLNRDKLDQEIQRFNRSEYSWHPV